jgi:hypothetical protein
MKTPYYEMFTAEGNALVNGVVQAAKVSGMQWDRVYSMLEKISEIDGFREATDTAVRDSVWVALTMADYERRVENI